MKKIFEFGAYVLAAGTLLSGGMFGADALLGSDAAPGAESEALAPPADGIREIRNAQFGFRFRHPREWREFVSDNARIVAGVARADGVLCVVVAHPLPLPGAADAASADPRRLLAAANAGYLAVPISGAGTRLIASADAAMGGRPARRLVVEAILPGTEALKIEAHATLHRSTVLVLSCMARARLFGDGDVKAAFGLAHASLRFE